MHMGQMPCNMQLTVKEPGDSVSNRVESEGGHPRLSSRLHMNAVIHTWPSTHTQECKSTCEYMHIHNTHTHTCSGRVDDTLFLFTLTSNASSMRGRS